MSESVVAFEVKEHAVFGKSVLVTQRRVENEIDVWFVFSSYVVMSFAFPENVFRC